DLLDGRHGAERFLVAVAMQQGGALRGLQLQLKAAGVRFRGKKLLEEQRMAGKACGFGQHDGVLVAESEEARRLQAEDRDLARRPRRERFERAPRLRSRLFHEPDGKEGAPAAKRAALQDGACDMDAILGRLEDADGRARVLRLEPAV